MVFMYFVERPDSANKEQPKKKVLAHLRRHGFSHPFSKGLIVTQAYTQAGPSGGPGSTLVAWPFYMQAKDLKPISYRPSEQTWLDCGEGIWLGWQTEEPPRPDELQHEEMVMGHGVMMNDGNEWVVPCARKANGTTSLPQVMQLDDEGNVEYKVKGQFNQLMKDAEEVWQGLIERWDDIVPKDGKQSKVSFTLSDAMLFRVGLNALAVNYRVGRHEVNVLELFDTNRSLLDLALALIDWPTIVEWAEKEGQKKKQTNHESAASEDEVAPGNQG